MTAQSHLQSRNTSVQEFILVLFLLLTTAITGEQHGDYISGFYNTLKVLAYGSFLILALYRILQVRHNIPGALKSLLHSYHPAFLVFVGIYFLGQLIGALRGPAVLSSLRQAASDGIVFTFAFLYFGWLAKDLPALVRSLLRILALAIPVLLLAALIPYVRDIPDLSMMIPLSGVNYPLLTLPFNHPNHFAYILMVGTLAAGFQFFENSTWKRWLWVLPGCFLIYGLYLTGGRGAMLGTGAGLLGLLVHHVRWLGITGLIILTLTSAGILYTMYYADPDQISSQENVLRVENRTFDVFESWDDERWQERVERNGGTLTLRSDQATAASFTAVQGSYRLLILCNAVDYRIEDEPLTGSLPEIRYSFSSENTSLAGAFLQTSRGWEYTLSPVLDLPADESMQIELGLVQPGFDVDPRGYVYIRHIMLIPDSFPSILIRIHQLLPKTSFAERPEVWRQDILNLQEYGPLGVGAGNSRSFGDMGMHNMYFEQYGEGGLLGLLGFLGWLITPLLTIRRSRLDRRLAWAVAAMMAALLVHGLVWDQFLNGLRFLTLVYVCLWTALATLAPPKAEPVEAAN